MDRFPDWWREAKQQKRIAMERRDFTRLEAICNLAMYLTIFLGGVFVGTILQHP